MALGESVHILTLQHTMASQAIQADDQLKTGPKLELASALEGAHKTQRKAIININRVLFWLCLLLPIWVWCEVVVLQITAGTCIHDTNKAEGDVVIPYWN